MPVSVKLQTEVWGLSGKVLGSMDKAIDLDPVSGQAWAETRGVG